MLRKYDPEAHSNLYTHIAIGPRCAKNTCGNCALVPIVSFQHSLDFWLNRRDGEVADTAGVPSHRADCCYSKTRILSFFFTPFVDYLTMLSVARPYRVEW